MLALSGTDMARGRIRAERMQRTVETSRLCTSSDAVLALTLSSVVVNRQVNFSSCRGSVARAKGVPKFLFANNLDMEHLVFGPSLTATPCKPTKALPACSPGEHGVHFRSQFSG